MEQILYGIALLFAKIHETILNLNNQFEYYLTDKELHFIVMGLIGMLLIFVLYPIFKWLAAKGHIMVVTFVYVLTVIIVIAFAIEVGQRITGTGVMESGDIGYGIMGFIVMFAVFAVIRGIYHAIRRAISKRKFRNY